MAVEFATNIVARLLNRFAPGVTGDASGVDQRSVGETPDASTCSRTTSTLAVGKDDCALEASLCRS
jgi:hypothetical protein